MWSNNWRIKKACWLRSTAIIFGALLISSIYVSISNLSMSVGYLRNFQDDQQPHDFPNIKISKNRSDITHMKNLRDLAVVSIDQRLNHHTIVHTLQAHRTQIALNRSMVNSEHGRSILNNTKERLRVLEALIDHYSTVSRRIDSDIVELSHCRLDMVNYSDFSSWAAVILRHAWSTLEGRLRRKRNEFKGLSRRDNWDESMYLEFCLSLLEIFATHSGKDGNTTICDFGQYSLSIQRADLLSAESTLRNVPISSDGLSRLVFVIIAFQDAVHLETLIEACHMPHHLIVVHVERRSPPSFTDSIHKVANKYTNVAVVQFGSILYQTDSVSTVNYQIMHWLTEELKLSFDYLLTLGNAVYPLYGAEELTNYFHKTERDIWLGELRSHENTGGPSWAYLERKRFSFTAGVEKYKQRINNLKHNGFDSSIPDYILTNMTEKTNSGNQAVFSYKVVKKLIKSAQVREIFSIAKYGCCCCLEERTWIAAARIIGYGREAMEAASMFQVWGGESTCGKGSMKNALLVPNATICYKSEDVTKGNLFERQRNNLVDNDIENSYFRGDKLMEELRLAKERGFLFARKFKSADQSSRDLIEMIKKHLHNN